MTSQSEEDLAHAIIGGMIIFVVCLILAIIGAGVLHLFGVI